MELQRINKKGQLSGMSGSIIALVVAIIVLVMGLVIVQELRDTSVVKSANAITTNNEFPASANTTGYTLDGTQYPGASGFTITAVKNATTNGLGFYNLTIAAANYTVDPTTGVVTNGSTYDLFDNVSINYTYSHGGNTFDSANKSLVGLGNFSDFIPLMVIAIAASIIIALILGGFAFSRGRNR